MEQIKDMIKAMWELLIIVGAVGFAIATFFADGSGMFETSGVIYKNAIDSNVLKNNGIQYIKEYVENSALNATYCGSVRGVGEKVIFRELFQVEGTSENDVIYLVDIRDKSGESVLAYLDAGKYSGCEVEAAGFIYEKDADCLSVKKSGVFIVCVQIQGGNGAKRTYEFQLPVEEG